MTDLTDLGIAAIRDGFRAGDFSAREVADAFIGAVESARALNPKTQHSGRHDRHIKA